MGFSRQEYWSWLPFPLQGIFLTQEGQGTHKALSLILGILSKEIFLPSKSHEPPLMHRRLLGRLASSV